MSIQLYGRSGKALRVNVVLEREDDRILGGLESTLGDGLDYILRHSKRTRTLVFSSDTHVTTRRLVAVQRAATPKV